MAAPQFVNGLTIDGGLKDLSGGDSVNNGRVGFFSDLYFDPNRRQWWGLSDRGPGGGTISYDTRVQRFSLAVNPLTGAISNFNIEQTVLFRVGTEAFNGLAPTDGSVLGKSFDPEGFVILPSTGNFLVADEYGPSLYEFDRGGQFVRQYQVPSNLLPRTATGVDFTANPAPGSLRFGREPNRGLEGLAISPDGRYAFAMLQNGTVTDGTIGSDGRFIRSFYSRILKYDTSTGAVVGQYAYRLEGTGAGPTQGRGISALVALDDHRFMVLERNNRGIGVPTASLLAPWEKKVYLIDIAGASEAKDVNLNGNLPAGFTPVTKLAAAFIDLASDRNHPSLAALAGLPPEKWEGLTVGPRLADGSFLLLAGTDNDYSVTQNSSGLQFDVFFNPRTGQRVQCDLDTRNNCFFISAAGDSLAGPVDGDLPADFVLIPGVLQAYKVSEQDLGGYRPPAPVPGPLPLFGAVTALAWSRRLRQRLRRLGRLAQGTPS